MCIPNEHYYCDSVNPLCNVLNQGKQFTRNLFTRKTFVLSEPHLNTNTFPAENKDVCL